MQSWRNMFPTSRAIIILLAAAVFSLTVAQAHLHFHNTNMHESDHSHSVDVHIFNAEVQQDHHDNSNVIEGETAGILKKQLDDDIVPLFTFVLFSMLITCLLIMNRHVFSASFIYSPQSRYRYFSPHLRAPPQQ